jgi:hypothetical protein
MYGHLLQDVSKLGSDLKIVTSNCTKLWMWCTARYKVCSGSSCTDKIKQHRELFFIFFNCMAQLTQMDSYQTTCCILVASEIHNLYSVTTITITRRWWKTNHAIWKLDIHVFYIHNFVNFTVKLFKALILILILFQSNQPYMWLRIRQT